MMHSTSAPRWRTLLLRGVLVAALIPGVSGIGGCTFTNGVYNGISNALLSRKKRIDYKYTSEFGVEDPQFQRSIDSIDDQMVGGNSAELLHNGDAIFPAMTGDIRAAQVSINLESFLFADDEAGRLFADAMIDAARRGVQVRLLVDDWGQELGSLKEEMEDAGVLVQLYRPLHLYSLRRPGIRTHRKLLIVDGRIGYTGGLGIDKRWLGNARDENEWRDTQVRVTGPVVAQLQSVFAENWVFAHGEILAGDAFYPPLPPTGSMLAHAIRSSGDDTASIPKLMYFMAINSAHRTIHIENAYFIPDQQVRRALIRAVRRGVEVEVLVPGKHTDLPFIRQTSRFHYGELLDGGVRIYEYIPTMLHNKTMVVDGIFSTIGSINFDARSMQLNAEESLSFYDRSFAAQMEAMFQDDKRQSHEIRYEQWKRRGAMKRATELISWIWEPYY